MTRQADFKRRVRARMAKTGESYATARSRLLAGHPGTAPDGSPLDWMREALHISNGDATDVPGTGLARRVLYWRDILHEGPVPDIAPAELRQLRAGFLAGHDSARHAEVMRQLTGRDRALEAGRDGEYVLWFEADLYDQLQVTEILARLAGLGEAFDRLSREYPATRDGLSLTERRVVAAIASGAPDAGTAFVRAGARETRPYLGDSTCFGRMGQLAEGPHPLLRLDPPGRPVERTTGVHLTGTGARVLAGEADQIALNGIDRWIGGVHLRGHHVPWRWDDGTETIIHLPGKT